MCNSANGGVVPTRLYDSKIGCTFMLHFNAPNLAQMWYKTDHWEKKNRLAISYFTACPAKQPGCVLPYHKNQASWCKCDLVTGMNMWSLFCLPWLGGGRPWGWSWRRCRVFTTGWVSCWDSLQRVLACQRNRSVLQTLVVAYVSSSPDPWLSPRLLLQGIQSHKGGTIVSMVIF